MTGVKELLQLIVAQLDLYAHQNGRNFKNTTEELKAFLAISFVMAINKLSTIAEYWRVDNLIVNCGFQNIMIQNLLCEILSNLHFAYIRKEEKENRQGLQDDTSDRLCKFEIFRGAIE